MKTQITTAVFAIALSMSLNHAEASNNSKSKEPDLSEENPMETVVSEISAHVEEELSIEAWMTDDNLWKINSLKNNSSNKTVEAEESLKIEPWMHSDVYFRITNDTYKNIESWMIDQNLWKY